MPATACLAQSKKMPQRPIFSKAPLLNVHYCFPSSGMIRSADTKIERLYKNANKWIDYPCLWEGLFRVACLLKNKPIEEPVYQKILTALKDTEDGSFDGTITDQIHIARAAMSVFEYNTDRTILKRIALWLRYLEIEFDCLSGRGTFLYQPADLMELFVRFYRITGMKSVLRLCARLRASAFDWTTALHTFQQSIPIRTGKNHDITFSSKPEEMDYNEKEKLINHAEMLADGIRFTLFSGIFSGHSQDLSSGRTIWSYLVRHHHALCGGTSANPFLCGCAADQKIYNTALAAWAEAFASQLMFHDSDWALEELIRIVFNGLEDCISRPVIPVYQRVNSIQNETEYDKDSAVLYARITRAVATAYQHSVAITEQGMRIQYLIPCRILLMMQKEPVVLQIKENAVRFHCKNDFLCDIEVFTPLSATADVNMIREGRRISGKRNDPERGHSISYHCGGRWLNEDGFDLETNQIAVCEDTHHQGVCFLAGNRLYSLKAEEGHYAFAVMHSPEIINDRITVQVQQTEKWHLKDGQPSDIPVLPETKGENVFTELTPYAQTPDRITMFPRTKQACLK